MAFDIVDLALQFIANYGLIAIFVLLVLDGALLLPVFPGEIVLIMAVAAYASDPGELLFLILFTTAAGLLGSVLLYGITRGGGRRLVERFPRFFMMPRKRRERLERVFQRPVGQSLVLFLRLVPFTRILVNIPAGLAKMPIVRFLVLSTIGLTAYHAAFLWFTFEANQPGSAIATEKERLQAAYVSPAWEMVQAHSIVSGAILLLFGIVLSVRASARMYHNKEESTGSLMGTLATMVLFWGGLSLAVATYMQPAAVYALIELGGVDLDALAAALDLRRYHIVSGVAALGMLFGLILGRMRRTAKRRRRQQQEMERAAATPAPGIRSRAEVASGRASGAPSGPPDASSRSAGAVPAAPIASSAALTAHEQRMRAIPCVVCGQPMAGGWERWARDVPEATARTHHRLHPACGDRIRAQSLAVAPGPAPPADVLRAQTASRHGLPAGSLEVWYDHDAESFYVLPKSAFASRGGGAQQAPGP